MAHEHDEDVRSRLLDFAARTSDFVGMVDAQSQVRYLNEAARKHLGVGDADDLTTADIFPAETFHRYYEEIRPRLLATGVWSGVLSVLTASGDVTPMQLSLVAQVGPGGEVNGIVTHGREVAPTGDGEPALGPGDAAPLSGRSLLEDRFEVARARANRAGHRVALAFVDVGSTPELSAGAVDRAFADNVLRLVTQRLSRSVRASDTVARMGATTFALLLDDIDDDTDAYILVERIRDDVTQTPLWTAAGELTIDAAFGLAIATAEGPLRDVLARAQRAARSPEAARGRRVVAYDEGADAAAVTLGAELAIAVSQGDIRPFVQPLVHLATGDTVGYQGLARWAHRTRGLLEAGRFIGLAAGTPMAPVIDLAVIRAAAAVVAALPSSSGVRLYAHLSRRLLSDPRVDQYLAETVLSVGLSPAQVCLEVAESLMARPSRAMHDAIRSLRDAGVGLALTSVNASTEINHVVEYGFDELHLDPALSREAVVDASQRRVVRGLAGYAHALDVPVAAIGVDDARHRDVLADAGCDLGRGELFGAPVPAEPRGA